jgi:DNA-directed RNA polymerase specialized sigma24 family protein
MSRADAPENKTGPDERSFDLLLSALSADRADAVDLYLGLRRRIVRFFEVRSVWQTDVAADTVIDRLLKKFENGERFDDISSYSLGVARMVALEFSRSPENRTVDELTENLSTSSDQISADEKEEKLSCLDECLDELPSGSRGLILEYYEGDKDIKIKMRRAMAAKLGIPSNALRNRAVRIRDKLERCVTKCLGEDKFG